MMFDLSKALALAFGGVDARAALFFFLAAGEGDLLALASRLGDFLFALRAGDLLLALPFFECEGVPECLNLHWLP